MDFLADKKILVTGGRGLLGSLLVSKLIHEKDVHLYDISIPNQGYDQRNWEDCIKVVKGIDVVIDLAGSIGGIGFAKAHPAELLYNNAIMGLQLMEAARQEGVLKYVAIGTACSYPKNAPVPFQEKDLWTGYPQEMDAPFGLAKRLLSVQSEVYRTEYGFNSIFLLLSNIYGPGAIFDEDRAHVIPANITRMLDAKAEGKNEVAIWGTGNATRSFLYVSDAADGILLATEKYSKSQVVNLGSEKEIALKQLIELIAELCGFKGEIIWDTSKPEGRLRSCFDVTKAKEEFGFNPKTSLEEGLKATIKWYETLRQKEMYSIDMKSISMEDYIKCQK